jgi:pyruvate,water dikinase
MRDLAELRSSDAPGFGGKSASLGELLGNGLPVPPGFALDTDAFDAFMAVAGGVDEPLDGLDVGDTAAVNRAAEAIAARLRRTAVPASVRAAVDSAYRALGEPPVAVRSSARGEDSAEATFAGQQETFLWVRGLDAVCEAIRDCWISLYSPPAITYRARVSDERPAMGVAVQAMVDAEVSGVLFTCSPLTGDPSVVAINSAWGLGLGVVGGDVTPDHFSVSKVTGEVLRRDIADKDFEHVPAPGGGTQRVAVAEKRRREPSLDGERLAVLVSLGRRAERHFGCAQDVEWAITRGGELFVLQSRPVTVKRPSVQGADAMSMVLGTFGVKRDR